MDRAADLAGLEDVVDEAVLLDAVQAVERGRDDPRRKWTSSAVWTSAVAPGIPASIRCLMSSALGIPRQGRGSLYFVKL